jgi:hypothetical protein
MPNLQINVKTPTKISQWGNSSLNVQRPLRSKLQRLIHASDDALRSAAFSALIDMVYEARLVWLRFDAGKAHPAAAFHAHRIGV